jgi:tRNASer (uridine44-2'-O)-methyltransferase
MALEDRVAELAVGTQGKPAKPKPTPEPKPSCPKFDPTYLPRDAPTPLSAIVPLSAPGWIVPLSAPAYFPLDIFHLVLQEQSLHPERNTSLILRAEQLPGTPDTDAADDALAAHLGVDPTPIERIRVRFVPRQRRDARLCQRNAAYSSDDGRIGLVLKTPEVGSAAETPYYHPPVRQLAFLWKADESGEPSEGPRVYGHIYIAYLPFEDSPTAAGDVLGPPPKPPRKRSPLAGPLAGPLVEPVLEDDSPEGREEARVLAERRLQRTCLHLLEKLHKHGYGSAHGGYVKRVNHDIVVSREPFQDLYQALKERHKQLDSRVPQPWSTKVEDVKRHVWKVSEARPVPMPMDRARETEAHPTTVCCRTTLLLGDNRTLPSPLFSCSSGATCTPPAPTRETRRGWSGTSGAGRRAGLLTSDV